MQVRSSPRGAVREGGKQDDEGKVPKGQSPSHCESTPGDEWPQAHLAVQTHPMCMDNV